MCKYYLISTEHLENGLWFRDKEDYAVAMNFVAIQAVATKVFVLAFILMSNHVHFVVKGSHEAVLAFINGFKKRYSQYYCRQYGVRGFLRYNVVDIKDVPVVDEALERAIAYVQMNPVAANICSHPGQYPWGTGNIFFDAIHASGRPVRNFSARELKRVLHSDAEFIPGDWQIGPEGFILPRCYVDVDAVEGIFHSPSRMNYFLNTSSKARKRLESNETQLPSFRDQVILAAVPDLCRSLFGKDCFAQLSEDEQTEFMRQIRFRFSASPNQIARICGVSYEDAARILDRA